jgi:hypothetical protein
MAYPAHAQELEDSRAEVIKIEDDWSHILVEYNGKASQLLAELEHTFHVDDETGTSPNTIALVPVK